MAQSLILERNAHTVKRLHTEVDGSMVIQSTTDVSAVVERAKALHNAGDYRTQMGDKHVASIPVPVLDAWARARGKVFGDVLRDQRLMAEFLQDPDHSVFRVWKGAI